MASGEWSEKEMSGERESMKEGEMIPAKRPEILICEFVSQAF